MALFVLPLPGGWEWAYLVVVACRSSIKKHQVVRSRSALVDSIVLSSAKELDDRYIFIYSMNVRRRRTRWITFRLASNLIVIQLHFYDIHVPCRILSISVIHHLTATKATDFLVGPFFFFIYFYSSPSCPISHRRYILRIGLLPRQVYTLFSAPRIVVHICDHRHRLQ